MPSQTSVVDDLMGTLQPYQQPMPQQQPNPPEMIEQPSQSKPSQEIHHKCFRQGCNNTAVENPDWEDEYCSQECVISHCRAVFANFQKDCIQGSGTPQQQSFPTVK
uniref:Uncharacterized protein n=1 Tax=Anopheles dirus TaxID=7168 RepID=A0A182N8F8_9DIPT